MEPFDRQTLRQRLRDVIESRHWSLAVTLASGDLLFGDFAASHVSVDNPHDFAIHIPRYWDEKSRQLGFAYRLEPFEIVYNDEDGAVHGTSWVLSIPHNLVVAIEPIWWDVLAHTGFKNAPNPYATLIATHNDAVAERAGLDPSPLMEFALSTAHVTDKGIHFMQRQLLYADYNYFERLPSTALSVGGFGVGAEVTPGLITLVNSVLDGNVSGKLHIPENLQRHVGFIEPASEEIKTEIEGDEWLLFLLSLQFPRKGERLPVLFRRGAVSYPREFWPHIKSPVTVIGEIQPIPLSFGDQFWRETITARVIGYLPEGE